MHSKPRPSSCDTFVALPPATADGSVVFGKNSDRFDEASASVDPELLVVGLHSEQRRRASKLIGASTQPHTSPHPWLLQEVQEVVAFAGGQHPPGAALRCTYITIPQAPRTLGVVLSKPTWMWGAEMGANEVRGGEGQGQRLVAVQQGRHGTLLQTSQSATRTAWFPRARAAQHGVPAWHLCSCLLGVCAESERCARRPQCGVVCGNEAVWTVEDSDGPPALLGMDLVRWGVRFFWEDVGMWVVTGAKHGLPAPLGRDLVACRGGLEACCLVQTFACA